MRIFTRPQQWLAKRLVKMQSMTLLPSWIRHHFLEISWDWLIQSAYKGNPTVYACMRILAQNFPEPELWAFGEDEAPILNHKLRTLLKKPNPDMGEAELMQFVITYAPLGGNVYLWKQRNTSGEVIALWPFHDGHMTPIPGLNTEEGIVAYYVLNVGAGINANPWDIQRHDQMIGVAIPKTEVVHWKWAIDPMNPFRGIGALQAAAGDIQIGNEVKRFIYSLLKNDAKPPIVVNLAEGDEFDEETIRRLGDQWMQKYGGNNRGRPAFLEHGMNVKELGFNLEQLQIERLQNVPDAGICMGFGIHPAVVGAMVGLENSTYSNFEEASRALTLQTLVPLWRSFASEMNQSFQDEKGFTSSSIRFHLLQVRALAEINKQERDFWLNAFNAGAITRKLFKEKIGEEANANDEVYKVGLTTSFIPAGQTAVLEEPKKLQLPSAKREIEIVEAMEFNRGLAGASTEKVSEEIYNQQKTAVDALRKLRDGLEPKMSSDIKRYFKTVTNRGMERFENAKALEPKETKTLPFTQFQIAAFFFGQQEETELKSLLETYYLSIVAESWSITDQILGIESQFDVNDPAVTAVLNNAGNRVKVITQTTKDALRELLKFANDNGWSIDDLASGRDGKDGIGSIVEMTYANRDRAIARTELGTAQQLSTATRYENAGADGVLVFDNGFDNSHENCKVLDGTVQTLAWAKENPLEHPNCVRAFGAWFDDLQEDDQ